VAEAAHDTRSPAAALSHGADRLWRDRRGPRHRRHAAHVPALDIELLVGDRTLDLVADGIDVAVRIGRLADSSLQAVRIGTFRARPVAAPDLFSAT